jgi:hypothetical protein
MSGVLFFEAASKARFCKEPREKEPQPSRAAGFSICRSGLGEDVRQQILPWSLKYEKLARKAGFFFSNRAQACLQTEVRKEKATQRKLGAFHLDYRAQRKTERSEGNPAVVTTNYQGVKNSVSSFLISMSVAVGVTKKSLKGVF